MERMTIRQLLQWGRKELSNRAGDFVMQENVILLAASCDQTKEYVYMHPDLEVEDRYAAQFRSYVNRRVTGEPLAYILGHKEFYGLDFLVNPHVLIPRPETEHLVEEVLHIAQRVDWSTTLFLDVGTGSGAIALAVAAHLPKAKVWGVDISPEALQVAKGNALRYQLYQVEFFESDLLKQVPLISEQTIVFMVNLPYLAWSDMDALAQEVKGFEPAGALLGGYNGIELYEQLFREIAHTFSDKECYIVFECDPSQIEKIKKLARFVFLDPTIRIYKDLSQQERGGVIEIEL